MYDDYEYSAFCAYNDYMANDTERDIMERDDSGFSIGGVGMGKFTAPYQTDYISGYHHFG